MQTLGRRYVRYINHTYRRSGTRGEARYHASLVQGLPRIGVVSTQVLQEYFTAATRQLHVRPDIARRKVETFARLDLVQVDLDLILSAIDLHRLHAVSFWDALIVRAALANGCAVLYSEDPQMGQRINGLRVVNPFV
jgi:predicted nucleic acid-binding protein